jgi:hypothetical protein
MIHHLPSIIHLAKIEPTLVGSRTVDWQTEEDLDMCIDQIRRSTSEPVLLLPPLLPPEPPTTIDILSQPSSGICDADEYFQSSPSTVLPFTPRYRQRGMRALEHVFRMAQNVNPALQGNSLTNAVEQWYS